MSKPKCDPWPLPRLLEADRNAATVYMVLLWLAAGRRQVYTTRARITAVCGLYRETITAAIQALDRAGWVRLRHGHVPARRWYRLTLAKLPPFPWAEKSRSREPGFRGKKPLKRAPRLSGKKPPNPLTGIGGLPAPALPPPVGGRSGAARPVPADASAQQERAQTEQTRARGAAEKEPSDVPF